MRNRSLFLCFVLMWLPQFAAADDSENEKREAARQLQPLDVFKLEWAGDPQISPDGSSIVYVRNFMDIMKDTSRSSSVSPLTRWTRRIESICCPRW